MQFYLLAPLLTIAALRAPLPVRWTVVSAAIAWCWFTNSHGWAGEAPRLDAWIGVFLLGVVTSTTQWRPRRSTLTVAVLATLTSFLVAAAVPATRSWIVLRGSVGQPLAGPLAAALTVGTILFSAPIAIATTRNPSTRFARFLGDLSFPLYLFHWLPRNWYYAHLATHPCPAVVVLLLAINLVSALAGGIVILLAIDRPVQRLRAKWVIGHFGQAAARSPDLIAAEKTFA